jgi:hypothetical protein
VPLGHHLHIDRTQLGQERNLEAPLPLLLLEWKSCRYQDFKFYVNEKRSINLMRLVKIIILTIYIYSRPECHVVSKAFTISMNTVGVDILPLKFIVTWSVSLMHWREVLWFARKPNWLAFSKFLSSAGLWIVLKVSFSKSLPVVVERLIERKVLGQFGSLAGFDVV